MNKYLFLLFISLSADVCATHIVNSRIQYDYIDSSSGGKRYRVSVVLTRDCAPNSITFPYDFTIGIYNKGSNVLYMNVLLSQIRTQRISECYGQCRSEAVYQKIVTLPDNASGYVICGLICCRDQTSNVLQNQDNESYQGSMPYCSINGSETSGFAQLGLPPDIYVRTGMRDTLPFRLILPDGMDSVQLLLSRPVTGGDLSNNFPDPPAVFPGLSYLAYSSAEYNAQKPLGQNSEIIVDAANRRLIIEGNTAGDYTVGLMLQVFSGGKPVGTFLLESIVHVSASVSARPVIKLSAAHEAGARVRLNWQSCFQGLEGFYPERSALAADNFSALDNTGTLNQYTTDTGLVSNQIYFYRIKGKGLDGSVVYSDTVQAVSWASGVQERQSEQAGKLLIMPQPAGAYCMLSVPGKGILRYRISDLSGRSISVHELPGAPAEFELSLHGMPAGLYQLELICTDGSRHNAKLLKQ